MSFHVVQTKSITFSCTVYVEIKFALNVRDGYESVHEETTKTKYHVLGFIAVFFPFVGGRNQHGNSTPSTTLVTVGAGNDYANFI